MRTLGVLLFAVGLPVGARPMFDAVLVLMRDCFVA
jgi:hypothetical protein